MLSAIVNRNSLFSGVIKVGAGVLGGIYGADILWLLAQKEGRVQQIAEPIIKKAEHTSPKYIVVGAPITAMGLHALLSFFAELTELKPIIAMKSVMRVYDFSIPFLLSGAMLVRCRSKLKGDTSIVLQLFWYLLKEGTCTAAGEVYKNVETLAKDIANYLATLEDMRDVLARESRDLGNAIDAISGRNRSETLTETLDNATAFVQHLSDWNQRIQGFEEKLYDYTSLANARKESFDEAPYIALEKAVQNLGNLSSEEREQVTLLYQTCHGLDCFSQIETQMEDIRTLRQEIEQLFFKGEHLVEGVLLVAEMNDIEVGALTNWNQIVRDMRVGMAGSVTTLTWDLTFSSRGSIQQSGKLGTTASIANNPSKFIDCKRKALESKEPEACRKLASSLKRLHEERDAAVQELERVHSSSTTTVHKPFFRGNKQVVNGIKEDLATVKDRFARHKLSHLDRVHLQSEEKKSRLLTRGIIDTAAPMAKHYQTAREIWNWWNQS